jgi:hypothetical protein
VTLRDTVTSVDEALDEMEGYANVLRRLAVEVRELHFGFVLASDRRPLIILEHRELIHSTCRIPSGAACDSAQTLDKVHRCSPVALWQLATTQTEIQSSQMNDSNVSAFVSVRDAYTSGKLLWFGCSYC